MQIVKLRTEEVACAAKFASVGLIGLLVDACVLRAGLGLNISPAIARIGSLFAAMQVTFTINGLIVFGRLARRKLARQWLGYMATNGVGNFCNYWAFVTLVSTHWTIISNPYFALPVGGGVAFSINYASARLLVFGRARANAARLIRERRRRTIPSDPSRDPPAVGRPPDPEPAGS